MNTGWYFGLDNQVVGPVDLQQLLDFLGSSEQWRRVLVWHEGFEEWKPVKDIPEIANQMTAKGPPPLPAPPVEPPPAPSAPIAVETPPASPALEPPAPAVTPPQATEPPAPVMNVAPIVSIVPDNPPAQPVTPPADAPKPVEAVAAPIVVAPATDAPVVATPAAPVAPPIAPAPPTTAESIAAPKRRRGWTAVLMVIALSAAGVLGHYTGNRDILSSFTKAPDIAAPPAQAKGAQANDDAIARGFADVVQSTTPSLPKKVDDWTVMYDVTASGRRMVYHHTLDTTKYLVPPNFAATMKQKMLGDACSGAIGEALKAGGSVEYRYHTQALFFVGNFEIAGGDCGAQTAAK